MSFLRLPLEWTNNQNPIVEVYFTLGNNASFESYMGMGMSMGMSMKVANQVLSRGVRSTVVMHFWKESV